MKLRAALCFALAASVRGQSALFLAKAAKGAAEGAAAKGVDPFAVVGAAWKWTKPVRNWMKSPFGVPVVGTGAVGVVRKIRQDAKDDQGDTTVVGSNDSDGKAHLRTIHTAALRDKAARMAEFVFFQEVTVHGCDNMDGERFDRMVKEGKKLLTIQVFRGFPPKDCLWKRTGGRLMRWVQRSFVYRPSPELAEVHLKQQLALILAHASPSKLPGNLCPYGVKFKLAKDKVPHANCKLDQLCVKVADQPAVKVKSE